MLEWRSIPNYENYEISSLGEVRNAKDYLLKPAPNGSGYLQVTLTNSQGRKPHMVHRLVAQTFIENPDNKPLVHHKDENKQNNSIYNLEWVDYTENITYSAYQRRKPTKLINSDGVTVDSPSRKFFVEELGFDSGCLTRLLKGEIDSYRGWRLYE